MTTKKIKVALTIAGSDSSAGAGIQADLKTFAAHGVYGVNVITAITAQSTVQISEVFSIPRKLIEQQLDTLLADIPIHAVKTGMLFSAETIEVVSIKIKDLGVPIIVDPVIKAGSGRKLIENAALKTLETVLFPIATLITPNIFEAEKFAQITIEEEGDMIRAAEKLIEKGARAVLVKGGHLKSEQLVDILLLENGTCRNFRKRRLINQDRHGSGCVLSAAITANLALGYSILEAVERAEKYLEKIYLDILKIGKGTPPINPFFKFI
ncbi:MAG: bifunctional hydroxymethylpyrimidine kinase/phosphomethylpyrimidine kinase [Candidatus Helarchaeota archaeon]